MGMGPNAAGSPIGGGAGAAAAGGMTVGAAVSGATNSTILFADSSGNLGSSSDADLAALALGRFKITSAITSDHVHMGHFDHCASATDYQIRLDLDGDTNIKAPGAGAALTLIGGDSGAGAINFFTNNSSRWTMNSSGHLIANTDNTFDIGATAATRPRDLHLARNLGFATGQSVALGGGAAPTFGTIGGSGPAAAAQVAWLKVLLNNVNTFIPYWQ